MTKTLTIAAGALALGLLSLSHVPAKADTDSRRLQPPPQIARVVAELLQEVTYGYRIPIPKIVRMVRHRGYSHLSDIEWRRHAYLLRARNWHGAPVRLKVDAYSGDIIWVKPIRLHDGDGWPDGDGWSGGGWSPYGEGPYHRGNRWRWRY